MKKYLVAVFIVMFVCACNNEGNDRQGTNPGDTLPTNQGNDTSSFERMPNRITDTSAQ